MSVRTRESDSDDAVLHGLLTILRQRRPGDRLPAERQLAVQFGVGRAAVRRALRELHHQELIETRRQAGSFVEHASRPIR